MNAKIGLILLILLLPLTEVSCTGTRVAVGVYSGSQLEVRDISVFYDELSPYGRWSLLESYGWVWTPYSVSIGWRPYTNGYWVYTDYGWTWVSYYPWGWGPFHYGRWFWHSSGWFWIPGVEWGPAWVSWRHGPGWIGWAPLPPQVRWHREGLSHRDVDRFDDPNWYCFVSERRFGGRDVGRHIEPANRNRTILSATQNITNYATVDDRIMNHGVPVDQVERATGQRVSRRRIVDATSVGTGRGNKLSGNDLALYRPKLQDKAPARTPSTALEQTAKGQRKAQGRQAQEQLRLDKQRRKAEKQAVEQQRIADQQKAAEQIRLDKQRRKAEQQKAADQRRLEKQRRRADQQKADQQGNLEKQQRKADQQKADQQRKVGKRKQKDKPSASQTSN